MKKAGTRVLLSALVVMLLAGCGAAGGGGTAAGENAGGTSASAAASRSLQDRIDGGDGEETWTVRLGGPREDAKILSKEDTAAISELWKEGRWVEDVTKCASDCVVTMADGKSLSYHSACGTWNDWENGRSLSLTEAETASLNKILAQYGEMG